MTLDLNRVADAIAGMVQELKDSCRRRSGSIENGLNRLKVSSDIDGLKEKISTARTSWLLAEPVDRLNGRISPGAIPGNFSVLATDGSQIDVDRHRALRCYLINIGSICITYGEQPGARLDCEPMLFAGETDMAFKPPEDAPGREVMIEGALLGIKRTVEEYRHLADMCRSLPEGCMALALIDGSLIMWGLMSKEYPDYIVRQVLDEGVLASMDRIRQLNSVRQIALASYISLPGSTDVVNTLRVSICPYHPADCDRYCWNKTAGSRPCDEVDGIQDRDLFWSWLEQDQRSDVFVSQSRISKSRYGANRVYFYYVRTRDEVGRIEVPEWVAAKPELLALSHSLVIDQCHKGQGYPVVLAEAHQQAVVTAGDRQNFYQLVDEYMSDQNLPVYTSSKSLSKKTRWI